MNIKENLLPLLTLVSFWGYFQTGNALPFIALALLTVVLEVLRDKH